jgi:hypothetical protein
MRKIIIILGVAGLSFPSLGAESAQNAFLKKPADAVEQPREHRRCAKKIVLGGDKSVVACLMRKRKGLTEAEETTGSTRDEPAQKRGAAPSSTRRATSTPSSGSRTPSHSRRRHDSH